MLHKCHDLIEWWKIKNRHNRPAGHKFSLHSWGIRWGNAEKRAQKNIHIYIYTKIVTGTDIRWQTWQITVFFAMEHVTNKYPSLSTVKLCWNRFVNWLFHFFIFFLVVFFFVHICRAVVSLHGYCTASSSSAVKVASGCESFPSSLHVVFNRIGYDRMDYVCRMLMLEMYLHIHIPNDAYLLQENLL